MGETRLRRLALHRIKELLDQASSGIVAESMAKEKGTVIQPGNPLYEASLSIYQAKEWIEALLEE